MSRIDRFVIVLAAPLALLNAPGAGAQDIPIALVTSLQGQTASMGATVRRGAEKAVADLNQAGGMAGRPLRLEIRDDGCDPAKADVIAKELVAANIRLVIGHLCSGASIAGAAHYGPAGVLMLTASSTNPRLTDEAYAKGWRTIFRLSGRDDVQGRVAANHIVDTVKDAKIGIVHNSTTYGQGLAEEMRRALERRKVAPVFFEAVQPEAKEFGALIGKIGTSGANVVYFGSYYVEIAGLLKGLRAAGNKAQLVAGDALSVGEFWTEAGAAGEGTLFTNEADARKLDAAKPYVETFRAAGIDPDGYTLHAYAGIQALVQAAEHAKSIETETLAKALRDRIFDTALGRLRFDPKGDRFNPRYDMFRWSNGKFEAAEKK